MTKGQVIPFPQGGRKKPTNGPLIKYCNCNPGDAEPENHDPKDTNTTVSCKKCDGVIDAH